MADTTNKEPTPPGGTATLAGRPVARMGFGAMQLSGPGGRDAPTRDTAVAVLRRAVELGVDHIDTAYYYGAGLANEVIRAALSPYPEDLVLVSKVGSEDDRSGRPRPAQRPAQLRSGVEANLKSLGVEQVHVVNLRRIDGSPGIDVDGGQLVDLDSQLAEMTALRDEGKIGGVGVSNVSADQLRQALPIGIACVQNAYSVLDRSGEPLLEICREHRIAWVPFFPLGSAFPGMAKVTEHPAVVAAARDQHATPAQVGLAWLLAHDPLILVIPGTTSLSHLEENVASADLRLDAETIGILDRLMTVPSR
jgi:aryl-alcohol dehydrogenase-like predicted oxidoreductase